MRIRRPSRLPLYLVTLFAIASSAESVAAASCKSYSSCREAVIAWCAGSHPRADGDNDGIPCENVCRSRAEVQAIMAEIGCAR
jgi:hypothetical protein